MGRYGGGEKRARFVSPFPPQKLGIPEFAMNLVSVSRVNRTREYFRLDVRGVLEVLGLTGDFCRALSCDFKIARVKHRLFQCRNIAGVSNLFETCMELGDKNRLCKRAFTQFVCLTANARESMKNASTSTAGGGTNQPWENARNCIQWNRGWGHRQEEHRTKEKTSGGNLLVITVMDYWEFVTSYGVSFSRLD